MKLDYKEFAKQVALADGDTSEEAKKFAEDTIEEFDLKQDLNGHYCLATKEHYDKLVEDGFAYLKRWSSISYYGINDKSFYGFGLKDKTIKPMHLHNNEWVFGTLEHDEEIDEDYNPRFDNLQETGKALEEFYSKPVEHITREEAKDVLFSYMERGMTMKNVNFETEIDSIFDYIEYLKKENNIIKALYVNEKGGSYAELSERLGYDVSDREK